MSGLVAILVVKLCAELLDFLFKFLCAVCVKHHTSKLAVKQLSALFFFCLGRSNVRRGLCPLTWQKWLRLVNVSDIMRRDLV